MALAHPAAPGWIAGRVSVITLVVTPAFGSATPIRTVTRDDLHELVFGPVLGALGLQGHHHEAMLLVGILYVDGDFVGQVEPELREHLAWPTDQAPTVVGRAVPLG